MDRTKSWIYDEETYRNLFLLCAINVETGQRRVFQISEISDDRNELVKWLREDVNEMIGFNNVGFDYPILHNLLTKLMKVRGKDAALGCYLTAQRIIENDNPWVNIIKNPVRKQIDIYKIHHFDNQAKRTSLKLLEFNLRMPNIRELPYSPHEELTVEQIKEVISYCENDVNATKLVYENRVTQSALELREKLSEMYGVDFTNFNDAKIGEYIFLREMKEKLGRERLGKTYRSEIDFKEIIFDYIKFKSIPFNKILEWFKNKVITETKGVFSKIPFTELQTLEGHYHLEQTVGKQKTLNVIYKGFQYDFGVGGIHGSIESGIYKADDEWMIYDIDVASYYPNIGIKNRVYPEHLSEEFCTVYENMYHERQKYPKSNPINGALKLALNGVYGKSNSEYSELYDPKYTMTITVNGQLMLCMLAEMIMETIPNNDVIMLQINTDGLTIKVKRIYKDTVKSICEEWEEITKGLTLEVAEYDLMVIRDVNNYLARYTNGNIKRKGAFDYELDLHQNYSMLVVPKAVEAYFLQGTQPKEFLMNHEDIYDFFKRTKIQKNHKLLTTIYENDEIAFVEEQQRVSRYYIAKNGFNLIKQMPPTESRPDIVRNNNLEAGYECIIVNNLDNIQIKDKINYDYYENEVFKIINKING